VTVACGSVSVALEHREGERSQPDRILSSPQARHADKLRSWRCSAAAQQLANSPNAFGRPLPAMYLPLVRAPLPARAQRAQRSGSVQFRQTVEALPGNASSRYPSAEPSARYRRRLLRLLARTLPPGSRLIGLLETLTTRAHSITVQRPSTVPTSETKGRNEQCESSIVGEKALRGKPAQHAKCM